MRHPRRLRFTLFVLAISFCAAPLFANRIYTADQLKVRLHNAPQRVSIQVPLVNGDPETIELERFEVWAPDGKIMIHEEGGVVRELPPPARFYYKGHVAGHDDSTIFISMDAKDRGDIQGIVLIGEKKLHFGRGIRKSGRAAANADDDPILITENDAVDELLDPAADWTCKVEGRSINRNLLGLSAKASSLTPKTEGGAVPGATYGLKIAVETDFELFSAFGSSPAVTTYITNLVGAASTIYQRDVNITLTLGNLSIYASASDPYFAVAAQTGLAELPIVWHNTPALFSLSRSAVVMVSGKITNSGIAWLGGGIPAALCRPAASDISCGVTGAGCGSALFANSFFGAYAWCGSSGSVATTVPNPNATVNGTLYALPTTVDFWMLLEFNHELGHVVGAEHTQCTALTAGEQTLYSTTRTFVDECYNADGAGCFTGSTNYIGACLNSGAGPYCPAPVELGTVMSYCHNVFSGGFRQSRFLFGKSGEPSFKMLGIITTAVDGVTPDGTITSGSNLPCAAGQTASVASCGGCTYAWQISGGTITSATNATSITFTPTAPTTTTVTSTITNGSGCSITTSKAISTQCAAILPPTNVVATATGTNSVQITWAAAAGAATYEVSRTTNTSTFNVVSCTPTPQPATSPCVDNTAVAGTAYIYKVKAVDPSANKSVFSNGDLATTVIFADDPLVQFTTTIQAVHVTQLRTAIDAVRKLANGGVANNFVYPTDPTITATTTVKRLHIIEMRSAINAPRTTMGLSVPVEITDTSITQFGTLIKALHFTELRNGVK